jgi:hypothetical protein
MQDIMNNKIYATAICIILLPISASWAGVGKISSPHIEKGEFEIEQSSRRYGDDRASKNNNQKHVTDIEYSFTDDWLLGFEMVSKRSNSSQLGLEEYGVETQYEFTQQGDWWLGSALKAEYLRANENNAVDEGELKLLLQRHQGPVKLLANINLVREMGTRRAGGVGLESALQGLYHCNKYLSPGIEWFAEYGNVDNFNSPERQEHYIGPVVKGDLLELADGEVGYEAGYYWGVTNASADNAQRIKISYETHF